jgi:hypothetical protein
MGKKDSSKGHENSESAKIMNPRVAMVPALLIQGLQIIYVFKISVPRIESFMVVAIGLAWLILLPGLAPVIYLTICQAINIYLASLVAVNVPKGSLYVVIPLLSMLFSIVAIILMVAGLRANREQKRVR